MAVHGINLEALFILHFRAAYMAVNASWSVVSA